LRLLLLCLFSADWMAWKKGHIIANLSRLIARGAKGKARDSSVTTWYPAGLAIFLFKDVLLQRRA
jgi:hypothetical protein